MAVLCTAWAWRHLTTNTSMKLTLTNVPQLHLLPRIHKEGTPLCIISKRLDEDETLGIGQPSLQHRSASYTRMRNSRNTLVGQLWVSPVVSLQTSSIKRLLALWQTSPKLYKWATLTTCLFFSNMDNLPATSEQLRRPTKYTMESPELQLSLTSRARHD